MPSFLGHLVGQLRKCNNACYSGWLSMQLVTVCQYCCRTIFVVHASELIGDILIIVWGLQLKIAWYCLPKIKKMCAYVLPYFRAAAIYRWSYKINSLIATLKQQSNGLSLPMQWLVQWPLMGGLLHFGTARRRLGGAAARPGPSSLYQMYTHQRPVYQLRLIQCSTIIAFGV